jgi:peptide/nickel transport system permease protein
MPGLSLLKFFVRRLWAVLISLLVITAIIFGTVLLAPVESRAQLYMGSHIREGLAPEIYQRYLDRIIREHGMNDPYPVQYFRWLSRLVQGEWGWSPILRAEVLDALLARTPATLELTLYSLLLFLPLGLLSGAIAGWNRNRPSDGIFRLFAYAATSIPPFIVGLVLMSIFYVGLYWFLPGYLGADASVTVNSSSFKTITGLLTVDGLLNGRPEVTLDAARHLALPVISLSLFHWATLGRVTRASVIEEVNKGYVVAAHARGLPRRRILWGHAVPNVLVPSLTASALSAATLITGVYVIELVFGWPGVSKLITNSMWQPDVAMATGFAVYSVVAVLSVMILLDIIQVVVDPRLRRGGGEL